VSVLITAITLTFIGIYNLKQNIGHDLEVSTRIVGQRNLAAILFDDPEFATKNLEVFSSQPAVRRACLYTLEGKRFAEYYGEKNKSPNCARSIKKLYPVEGHFYSKQEILDKEGERVGYIFVESDKRKITAYIDTQLVMSILVICAAMLVAYLLARVPQRNISRPILDLAEIARHISTQRDFSLRASIRQSENSRNEITTLYSAFNTMLTEIDAREKQLLKTNDELYAAKVRAEDASRAKSEFLANVSHELRTPLNAIIGFSSIIMNQLFGAIGSDKYREYAQDINDSGVHLLDIINDILDLSKAEAGKLTLSFEEVNVARAIRKCITLISERANEHQIRITTEIPETLPPLYADNVRFIQIILNVLSNAVKFTNPGGKVHIAVKLHRTEASVMGCTISIEDTGIGMSADEIEVAFQSFGQIDSGLNRKYEGTGLGLPLTKKLIELHHGEIEVQSERGKGTKVSLYFPAEQPDKIRATEVPDEKAIYRHHSTH
jgi:signal transduction histidine kinase